MKVIPMMMKCKPPSLFFLSLFMVIWSACESADSMDTEAIIRINQQMSTQFQQEQHAELTSLFADSAILIVPGNYQVIGKQMIQAYWTRYLNPLDLTINHLNFYSTAQDVAQDATISLRIKSLLPADSIASDKTVQSVYQSVDWELSYESEDGVVRHEVHPTLLLWRDDEQRGWRIDWMAQI